MGRACLQARRSADDFASGPEEDGVLRSLKDRSRRIVGYRDCQRPADACILDGTQCEWSVPACCHSHYNIGRVDSMRSEEHTSELQSLMRISYAVFCLKKKNNIIQTTNIEIA